MTANDQEIQGFSSQQQPDLQMSRTNTNQKLNELIDHQRIHLTTLFNIQPAEQIRQKQYSLEPDMLSGWKPKHYLPKPIPLIFYNDQLDFAIEKLIKMKTYKQPNNNEENTSFIELVYLGPRYQSTYSAWYQKHFPFPYTHLNKNKRLKFTDRQFVGQYWNAQTPNHLHFDSFFQSGNLDVVFKIGEFQYDLFMRVDSNTRGHLQWFNFKVKNMIKGNTYKFHISNFLKSKSLYSRGMKPFVFSKKQNEQNGTQWHQGGQNIKYDKKTPKSFKICMIEIDRKPNRLSFQFECQHQNDEVQFAYCIPYEYSRLKTYLQNLQKRYEGRNMIKVSRLSYSLGGLDIPVVTITSELKQITEQEINSKKLIVASGRIHPGESNGSFMMEGFIEYLCSNTEEAECLRSQIVFKIIPMLNPDGVVLGNYRTSLSGKDLNRQFINPDEEIFPQIYNLKKYIGRLRQLYKKDFLMYLDFHGHSTKKNCFTYGPEFSITNTNYYQCRIFPKLISTQTQMFRFFSCIFKISQCKQRTLRAVLLKNYQLDLVYTLEVSNGSYYNHQLLEDVMFDQQKWIQMGQKVGKSVFQYVMIFIELQKFRQAKKQQRLSLKKQKQKFTVRPNPLKKDNSLSKDKISLSVNKQIQIKNTDKFSISKISPGKRKTLGYQNNDFNKIQTSFDDSPLKIGRQNFEGKMMIPELEDQKLNSLLKSIYSDKKQKNQLSDKNHLNQNEFQENKSNRSDDNISEGGSDSSSSSQDLNEIEKKQLFKSIKLGSQRIRAMHSKKKKKQVVELSQTLENNNNKDFSVENENQADVFFTQIDDSSNSLEELRPHCKINSIKMNQLRSKRHIYLKKKSYHINNSPSPKRQNQNSQTAKIVNFQFSLNPIKTASKIWHQKEPTSNTIHSIFKNNSIQKIQAKVKHVPFLDCVNKSFTQRNENNRLDQQIPNFKKRIFSAQKDRIKIKGITSIPKSYNMSLLRKTQQKKLNLSSTFYKSQKPDKDIHEDNLRGKRILSSPKRDLCVTQISNYQ